jgi:hypothetical protein
MVEIINFVIDFVKPLFYTFFRRDGGEYQLRSLFMGIMEGNAVARLSRATALTITCVGGDRHEELCTETATRSTRKDSPFWYEVPAL